MQDFLVVNQESEISNINSEIQPASVVPPPKDAPKKNRRGRPRKNNASAARPVAGSSGSANATAVPVSPRANLPEFDLVLDALSLKVRPSTSAAYRKPLEDWQNADRSIILSNDNESSDLILLQTAENAPSSKTGSKKIIDVPLGVEVVNQYKKALIFLYYYKLENRSMPWPSPKKTKEVMDLVKKYERDLIYDQVQTNADRAAHCVIRDSYKSGELIRMLKNLWVSNNILLILQIDMIGPIMKP
ncbi:hypothetical protein MBANPS3_012434 [Mucor bainieri]